jgi:hypothetical protein
MTIANDIIRGRVPDYDAYMAAGETLDDIDEYGFTPLIETVLTRRIPFAETLIKRGVDVNKVDVTGRTALHWAVDNNDIEMARLLLDNNANPNAYTRAGLSVLVYPVLRGQDPMKQLLYQYQAKLDFALDFIVGKLIGHRFSLKGDVDILNTAGEFIELDYEGFILEFTVAVLQDSIRRFTSSYSTKHLRHHFSYLYTVMDAIQISEELLQLQQHIDFSEEHTHRLQQLIRSPMLVLPAASRGHAMCFVRFHELWAKIDRGENSIKEGSVNIYRITKPQAFDLSFIENFLYKKQTREYFHEEINHELGLIHLATMPMSSQISGNCSWANVQAVVAVGYALQKIEYTSQFIFDDPLFLYEIWVEWDQDRALDECIQQFYIANPLRKASLVAMLGGILFQNCDDRNANDVARAEKILKILTLPDYYYILQSYLDIYCVKRLTRRGNNLLKLLDDCGFNPNIGVTPIATSLGDMQ